MTGSGPGCTIPAPPFDAFVCTVLEANLHLACTGTDRERWKPGTGAGALKVCGAIQRHRITPVYARLTDQNHPFTGMWGSATLPFPPFRAGDIRRPLKLVPPFTSGVQPNRSPWNWPLMAGGLNSILVGQRPPDPNKQPFIILKVDSGQRGTAKGIFSTGCPDFSPLGRRSLGRGVTNEMARFVKPVIGIYKLPPLDSLDLSAFEGGCVECSAYVLLSTSIASDFIWAVGASR